MRKRIFKNCFWKGLVLILALLFVSCSRDKDEEATYTARLEVKYNGNALLGSVFYNDELGNRKEIDLHAKMDEVVSFQVRKGYRSKVEIEASGINGSFAVRWTVINNMTGVIVQNFKEEKYTEKDEKINSIFEEVVK